MARNTIARTAASVAAPVIDMTAGTITGISVAMLAKWHAEPARVVAYDIVSLGSVVTTVMGGKQCTGVVTSSSVNTRGVRNVTIWVINPDDGAFALSPVTKDGATTMAKVKISGIPTTHLVVRWAAPVAAGRAVAGKKVASYLAFMR